MLQNFKKSFFFKIIKSIRLFRHHQDEKQELIAKRPIFLGLKIVIILFGSFAIWGLTFKIDSTAIAMGKIILNESKKVIQHLEGGIIEEILVKEGERIYKGQILIKLSKTAALASKEQLKKQLIALKAAKTRLEAERDGKKIFNFAGLINRFENDEEINKILRNEQNLFISRKKSLNERINILNQKIKQLEDENIALNAQIDAISKRIIFSKEELRSLKKLYKERIIAKNRYLEIKKQLAELEGNYGQYLANISKVKQTITQTKLEIINLKTERHNEVIEELQQIQTKIVDFEERIRAAADILNRTIIIAPQDGIVNNLQFHTKGGVIPPAAEIMELIPQDDELIVEVKVNPQDIDVVIKDLKARVRLAAYKTKEVPLLKGVVSNVGANIFEDQAAGISYFLVRIKIDKKELNQLKNVSLYPGMPVEAYIITGSRTFFEYLFDPITVSMRRALREE